jgi:sn-glycerol 3-phosphate transport system ATP-binding protein
MLETRALSRPQARALSGGQRQRVAMGRAIVREPAVFLFDEPLSNLDAKLRVQMRLEIKALQRKLGVTALYVTHDQVEAMTLADRMIVMNAGVAEQIGAPLEVYANPATLFVAGFIGSPPMNVLSHDIRPGRGPLDPGAVIGIRPEHIDLVAPGAGLIDFDVAFCEPLGAETLVHGVTPQATSWSSESTARPACLPMARASAWQSIRRVSWHLTPPAAARKSETVQQQYRLRDCPLPTAPYHHPLVVTPVIAVR